jgi:hypothetical protein
MARGLLLPGQLRPVMRNRSGMTEVEMGIWQPRGADGEEARPARWRAATLKELRSVCLVFLRLVLHLLPASLEILARTLHRVARGQGNRSEGKRN